MTFSPPLIVTPSSVSVVSTSSVIIVPASRLVNNLLRVPQVVILHLFLIPHIVKLFVQDILMFIKDVFMDKFWSLEHLIAELALKFLSLQLHSLGFRIVLLHHLQYIVFIWGCQDMNALAQTLFSNGVVLLIEGFGARKVQIVINILP